VRDPKFGSLVDGSNGIFAYVPLQQRYVTRTMIAARSANGDRLSAEIREAVESVAPELTIGNPQKGEDYVAVGLLPQRVAASVAGSLGVVGTLLAGIGIFGVTASMVTRRQREIAIRAAPDAQRGTPVVFGGATILFITIGLLACYLPTRRAVQIDLTQVLRDY